MIVCELKGEDLFILQQAYREESPPHSDLLLSFGQMNIRSMQLIVGAHKPKTNKVLLELIEKHRL